MPKSVDDFSRLGNERRTTTLNLLAENVNLIFVKHCKIFGSDIRKLWAFRDSDCTLGASVRKTAGARSCCIPELLAMKGLKKI